MKIKIKICGITNYNDAALAVKLGAEYIGFIFAESPRQVKADTVADILHRLREQGLNKSVKTVGVFVNEQPETIEKILTQTGIDLIQLHGDETSSDAIQYPFQWYKALRISSKVDVDRAVDNWTSCCSQLLIDTKVKDSYGGTGKRIAEEVALYAKNRIVEAGKRFFLAGGINPENVYSIVTKIQPDGIDIGSGVEGIKGKKSKEKMIKLFKEIEQYRKETI